MEREVEGWLIPWLVFGLGIRYSWVQIPARLLISCVALGKSLHLSLCSFIYKVDIVSIKGNCAFKVYRA